MTPALISGAAFIFLEGARAYNPMLAFGLAGGMVLTSIAYLIAEKSPPHP